MGGRGEGRGVCIHVCVCVRVCVCVCCPYVSESHLQSVSILYHPLMKCFTLCTLARRPETVLQA